MPSRRLFGVLCGLLALLPVQLAAQDMDGIRAEHANSSNRAFAVSSPVRTGPTALAFQVADGQCAGNRSYNDCANGRERSEIVDRAPVSTDTEQWYAFSVFIPSSTRPIDPANTILAQWQDTRGSGEITLGFALYREGLELTQDDPRTRQTDDMNPPRPMVMEIVVPPSRLYDRWQDIRVQAVWSAGPAGLINVWINDRLVHSHRGPNLNRDVAPSFKFGVYRSGLGRIGRPVPTQLVVFDHIRRGATEADVLIR
ncbi:polysaccharide lyase [Roseicyclus sp.]